MTSVVPAVWAARRRWRATRRWARGRAHASYSLLVTAGRALPIPPRARVLISAALLRRPWQVSVPVDKLLLGAQNGWTATEFAERTGDLLWPSTPLRSGPHVALLRLADERAEPLSDQEILDSLYGQLALRCIDTAGDYFGATRATEVVALARSFIAHYRRQETQQPRRAHQSRPRDPVLVAPIYGSDCYQVLDGHHRLAIMAARGESAAKVTIKWLPVTTPLQDLLTRMSWLDGTRELYQPLDAPELRAGWTIVRRCSDRLEKMRSFLDERELCPPATSTYLDIASCYGWFVAQMRSQEYQSHGIERDPLAVPLGQAAYGLDDGSVRTGDCVELLQNSGRTWDIVSCFSLLHHFVLGRGSISAEELLRLIDKVTGRVLFLDTGQEHEAWFQRSLQGWNPESIERFLRRHTSFDEVVDLGPDEDARPPYADNYGRHLFACLRRG